MTQKALLQGAGDGTAVPAGYVGEHLEAIGTTTITGSTTAGTFTTLVTLTNVPSGKWRFDFTVDNIGIVGTSGDTGAAAQGRIACVSIFKNGTELQRYYGPGLSKSTVNSGYLLTSVRGFTIETKSTTDTYDIRFSSINNSGTPSITQLITDPTSIVPIKFTATRIA